MGRGPKPLHPSVQALRGEPHLRRRNLQEPEKVSVPVGINQVDVTDYADIPDFLLRPREKEAFRTIIDDYLQRRVARKSDLAAYGRWAVYLEMFIEVKDKVQATQAHLSDDGRALMRTLESLEAMLYRLETSLGLNPIARQQIIRTLAAAPMQAKLIDNQPDAPKPAPQPDEHPASPLAFLQMQ